MTHSDAITFERSDILAHLESLDDAGLDELDFGVIGFASDTSVCRYNAYEAQEALLAHDKVIGLSIFTDLAQCMNNFMVAQRFADALSSSCALDATIDFTLTWRMRPTKVKLRMLYAPEYATRYVLLHRLA
jgi:photoactive yellow protein